MCDESIADVSVGAGFVVDDDLLTPDFGELFSDDHVNQIVELAERYWTEPFTGRYFQAQKGPKGGPFGGQQYIGVRAIQKSNGKRVFDEVDVLNGPQFFALNIDSRSGKIEFTGWNMKVTIKAAMGCDGMVVLSDTIFPGWYAKVDGKPASIYEVNAAMRGVPVPQGTHTVEMVYRPRSVYVGAALTFLGLAGALVIARVSTKRTGGQTARVSAPLDLRPESRNNTG